MTMGLPWIPLYLRQCMGSLQHICTMLMLLHSISRTLGKVNLRLMSRPQKICSF
jgi:hypothetical protein